MPRAPPRRRGMGVAEVVRLAVVMGFDLRPPAAVVEGADGQTPACNPAQPLTRAPIRTPSELTLRLPRPMPTH